MLYRRRIFISYDYEKDKHYKNLLLAWDSNKLFDFSILDHSADVSINSRRAGVIKSVLSRYIRQAPFFLVIIGERSYKSQWVTWEIEKAVELNRRIVAVKINRGNKTPACLYDIGASWALSFSYISITNAIAGA